MNFNEFYLNSFKDSNDILDGSNVIIKGNVAVNKLNPSQHIDVSGNIKASNKLIANILELSGNNITVDNSNNITFNKAKFSHIFPAIPADISASANNANDGGTDIGNPTNAFRKAYIQELFVSKNSISLGDDVKISATDTGNLNATTSVSGVETTTKIIRADPNGQISPDDMAFTGLRFRNNFKPENTSNDNNATELNTLKNSITDLSNGDYLICHSFFKIGQPSSAFTEQVDISGKDISSGDILIWVQNTKWALVNFKVPYFSLEANHIVDGSLPISKTTGLQTALNNKQNTLIAGTGITINGDTISSTNTGGLTDLSQTSINDLSDVNFNSTTTTNGKALIWNSTTKLWEPGQAGNPINETTDVSLNNLKVHGDLSANDASFNNVTLNNITLNNIIGNPTTTTQSTDNSSNRIATTGFVKNNIQSIINNAPAVLDTLSEIANAIDNSANFATNINSNISTMKSDIATKQNSFSAGSHLQLSSNILNVIPSSIKSSDLSDISFNLTSIQNNHVLAWDSTNNYFTNSNIITQQITTLSSEVARDISNIVNGAPAVLDTLKELADAIDGSANFATNVKSRLDSLQSQINTKNSSIDHTTDVEMKDLSANDASFNSVKTNSLTVNGANINVQTRKQQLLEIVSGVCDGRTISGESGNYTLFNVSSVQSLGPSNLPSYNWVESWYNTDSYFFELSGSSIAYTPPSGTRQVIYHFSFNINETSESGSALWFRFFIDDNEVQCLRRNKSNHVWGSNIIDLKYIVDIDANIATDDISNAKLKSWTSSKTMKIDCAVYLNNIKVHCANWNDSAPILAKPTLKIESIGIDENIHTSNNVRIIDLSNNLNAELIGSGTITNTEFSYLDGLTGSIQSQLNLKHSTIDSTTDLNTKDLSANNAKIHDLSVNKIYINSNLQKHIDLSNVTQSIIPSQNNVYTLGDVSNVWKDVYIGPGSLYIDGKKVIESNNDTINITTDENQNLTVKTTGTGILKLESSNGLNLTSSSSSDITINPAGSIKLNSNIQIADGVEIQNPNGNDINFIDNITLSSGKKFIGDTSSNTITCSSLSVNGVNITQNGGGLTNLFQTSINDLSDVSLNGIQTGQYIKWDGEKFIPGTVTSGSGGTTINENTDISLNNLKVHGDLSANDVSFNVMDVDTINSFRMNGHILPTSNAQYDLGSAEYKIRHLFLSDNSLWLGDEHKLDVSGGKMRFRKRKKNSIPSGISSQISGASLADAQTRLGKGGGYGLNQFTLHDWVEYSHLKGIPLDVNEIFNEEDIDDDDGIVDSIKNTDMSFNKLQTSTLIVDNSISCGSLTVNGVNITENGGGSGGLTDLSQTSINDLSDVSLNNIAQNQLIKWDGEKLVPTTVAQTIPKQGQVLDVLMGYTGTDVSSATGTYSIPSQTLASSSDYTFPHASYVADPATLINYTAPAGTKYIQIDYHSNIINASQYGALFYKLYVNDTEIEKTDTFARIGLWTYNSYNLSIIVSAEDVYDTSNVNITSQNKYQIWIKSEQSAHTVKIRNQPRKDSFIKFTAIGESQGVDVTLTNTSIKDISDVSIDNIQKNQLIKWDGEKLVPTSSIIPQTTSKDGQVLDVLMGYTGTDVSSATGTYSIPSQTLASSGDYTLPTSYVSDPATLINYTAPAGTKFLKIKYYSNITNLDQYGLLQYILYVNDTPISNTETVYRGGLYATNSYNLSILVSAQDVYDTSNVNITGQNKYQIWIKSYSTTQEVRMLQTPTRKSFIKFTAVGESQGMDVNLGVASINDLSDVNIDNIENGQYIKWNDGKLVPTSIIIPQTQTPTKKGQLLETLAGVCDGRSITVESGTYTLSNITQGKRLDGSGWTTIPGSAINYKPPTGAKQVIYNFIVNVSAPENRSILQVRCKVDGEVIDNIMYTVGSDREYGRMLNLRYIINIGDNNGSEDNTENGILTSWNSLKEIKLEGAEYHSGLYDVWVHKVRYSDTDNDGDVDDVVTTNDNDLTKNVVKPQMIIKAFGESSGLDVTLTNSSISDLSDVSLNGIQTGQYIKWDGEKLVPGTAINETADISLNKLQIGSNGSSSVLSVYGSGNQKPLSVFKSNSDCSIRIQSDGGESFLEIANIRSSDGNSSQSWGIGLDDGTRSLHFRYKSNETMNLNSNYSNEFEAMTIYNAKSGDSTDYNGFVGIGITNPTKKLEVAGDISCSALTVNGVSITQNGGGGGGSGTAINETTDVSLNNLKVHGSIQTDTINEKTDSSGVTIDDVLLKDGNISCSALTVNGVSITQNGGGSGGLTDLSQTSINDLSDVSLNNIAQNQLIKWDGEKLVPTTVAQTIPKHGQLLDSVIGSAGQTDISSATGVYDLSDNSLLAFDSTTNKYIVPTTYVPYPASYIQYKAPVGTSRIIFEVIASDVRSHDSTGYVNVKLYINGNALDNQVNVVRTGQYMWNYSHWFFVITDSMVSNLSGNPSITDTNTYQLYIKSYSSSREIYIDKPYHDLDNETQTGPLIKLRAIGESQGVDVTLTNTSIKDISDVSIDNIQKNQLIKWDGEKLVPTSSIIPQTTSKHGQILDSIVGHAGETDISSATGLYDLCDNSLLSYTNGYYIVPTRAGLGNFSNHIPLPSSYIQYKAPVGTKRIIIEMVENLRYQDGGGYVDAVLYINGISINSTNINVRPGTSSLYYFPLYFVITDDMVSNLSGNPSITDINTYQVYIASPATTHEVKIPEPSTTNGTINFFKLTAIGESQGMDVNLGVASINDLSDVNIDNIENGQYIKWNDGKFVPTSIIIPQTQTPTKQGQVLEYLNNICNGTSITVSSGTYTFPNVTQWQNLSSDGTWDDITGSNISYKPPPGTKCVIYKFRVHIRGGYVTDSTSESNSEYASMGHMFYIDDQKIGQFNVTGNYSYGDRYIVIERRIFIGGTTDYSNNRISSWDTNKTLKIKGAGRATSNQTAVLHDAKYDENSNFYTSITGVTARSSSGTATVYKPQLTIIAIGESQSLDVTLTNSSIGDLSDVNIDNIENGQYIKWNDGKLVPTSIIIPQTQTPTKQGQILEKISGICDGRTISGVSGTYTLSNVTSSMSLTTTYTTITGSEISYTPPTGTKQVVYIFKTKYSRDDSQAHSLSHLRLYIDDVEQTGFRRTFSGGYLGGHYATHWTIDIGNVSSVDNVNSRFPNWNSSKTIKIKAREWGSSNEMNLHTTHFWDGGNTPQFSAPHLEIIAIGESSGLDVTLTNSSIGDLSDVSLNGIQTGQYIKWDGEKLVPGTVTSGGTAINETTDVSLNNLKVHGSIQTDTINEKTDSSGVTIDGVLLKDSDISCNALTVAGNSITSSQWTTVNTNEIHYSSGNVGIGTNNPEYKLDIGGNTSSASNTLRIMQADGGTALRIGAGSPDSDITILRADGSTTNNNGESDNSARGFSLKYMGKDRDGNNNSLSVFADNNGSQIEAITIHNDGNVGIGTTNPSKKLEVAGDISCNALTVAGVSITGSGGSSQWTTVNTNEIHYSSGNVGIGTNNPSAKLEIKSNTYEDFIVLDRTGHSKVDQKIYLTPSHGDDNNTQFRINIGPYVSSNGNANTIASFQEDGNVGIGTTNPSAKLEISGIRENQIRLTSYDTTVGTNETVGGIEFYSMDSGYEGVKSSISVKSADNNGNCYMTFSSGTNTERMRIDSNGNVGIGTTNPQQLLHLKKVGGHANIRLECDDNQQDTIEFKDSSHRWAIYKPPSSTDLRFYNYSTTSNLLVLKQDNKVGIGTTDPDANLHINGSYNNWAQIINTGDNSLIGFINQRYNNVNRPGISFGRNMTDLNNQKNYPNIYSYNYTSDPALVFMHTRFAFSTTNSIFNTSSVTERLSILNNGRVGIGTTNPTKRLHIKGNGGEDASIKIESSDSNGAGFMYFQRNTDGKSYVLNQGSYPLILGANNSFNQLYLKENGNVGIGTTDPDTYLVIGDKGGGNIVNTPGIHMKSTSSKNKYYCVGQSNTKHVFLTWYYNTTESNAYAALSTYVANGEANSLALNHGGGNVGIGITNPTKTLEVAGDISCNALTVAGVSITASGGSSQWTTVNTNEIHYSSGNVGIGTTDPKSSLHVYGGRNWNPSVKGIHMGYDAGGRDYAIEICSTSHESARSYIDFTTPGVDYEGRLMYQHGDHSFKFYTNSTERLVIDKDGNVGIGTTKAITKLDIRDDGACRMRLEDSTATNFNGTNASIEFTHRYSTIGYIQQKGQNLRIGTTGGNSSIRFYTNNAGSGATGNTGYPNQNGTTIQTQSLFDETYTGDNDIPKMVISKDGVVKIGINPTDVTGSTKLQLDRRMELIGNNSTGAGIWFNHTAGTERNFFGSGSHSGGSAFDGLGMYFTGSGSWRYVFLRNGRVGINDTTPSGTLDVNGTIYKNGSVFSSDRRIKTNIVDVSDNQALDILRNIPCRYYEYKDKKHMGDGHTIGFIAQEVKEQFPIAVKQATKFIPNIMKNVSDYSWNTILYDNSDNLITERIYDKSGNDITVEKYKLTIPDLSDNSGNVKYRFYVSEDSSGNNDHYLDNETLNFYTKSFIFEKKWAYILLYGSQVDDFNYVHKDKLFAVNFSATQELDKLLTIEKQKVTTLENKVTSLEDTIQSLISRITALENQ